MHRLAIALAVALAAAGCGRDDAGERAAADSEVAADGSDARAALPAPVGTPGQPVTGMPPAADPDSAEDEDAVESDPALASGEPIDPALLDPSLPAVPDGAPGTEAGTPGAALAGAAAGTAQTAAAATADEAIALVRQYHAELDRGAFDRAYLLWADDGRASGQSLDGFAAGLRETVDVQAEVGAPTRMRSGTAAQYVEVPVTVTLQYRDGRMRRLEGTYLLRRALAADAAENDRQWRINSVLLREAPSS